MAFLKTVINQKYYGQDVVNILCWSGSQATIANGQAITDELQQIFQDTLSTVQGTPYSFESVTCYDAEAPNGTPGVEFIPTGGGHVGVATGNPTPTQTAAILAFNTFDGPPHRGRIYIAGLTANLISSIGTWNSTALSALDALGAKLLTFAADTGIIASHVVIGNKPNILVADQTAGVNAYIARNVPATQRRRRIGVGS